jgi:transposase
MPRSHPSYPADYRRKIVELARAGRTLQSLAAEYEPCANTIANWVKQADLDEGVRDDGLTSSDRDELRRLKREVKRLREEREILKKAAAWFARETDSLPKKGSSS